MVRQGSASEGSGKAAETSGAGAGDSGSEAGGDEPSAAAGAERTAVFRAVRPGSAGADSAREAEAKPKNGSASAGSGGTRTTAFGAATSDPAPEDGRPEPAAGADSASGRAASADAGKPSSGPAAASERTAVFRTVKPASAPADSAKDAGEDRPADAKPGSGSGSGSGGPRTTAFGVVTSDPAPQDADARPERGSAGAPVDPRGRESSERTAVFRTVKPGSADAGERSPAGSEQGSTASPAGSGERTAVFRTVKPGTRPAPDAPAGQDPRAAAGTDERTAVSRAEKPGSASADAKGSAPAVPGKSSESGKDAESGKAADARDPRAAAGAGSDERTAVFRAVKPGSAPADAKGSAPAAPGKSSESGKDAESGKAADARDPRAAAGAGSDERTAVFRAVKPGSAPADAKGSAPAAPGKPAAPAKDAEPGEDSERTAVFRAVKPGSAPAGAGKGAPGKPADADPKPGAPKAAPAPEARVSKFVPLGDEPPKPPAPKPDPAAAPTVRRLDPSERTTQQPLPPRPPLDMLADLTNNPPPPPSPMRTVVRRVKIYAPIVVLLAVILAVVQLVRPLPAPKLVLTAKSQYTFPGGAPELPWPTEGQASMAAAGLGTIGSSGEQKPVPIASVTKSMTAYIIMRDHPFKKGEKGALIDVDKTAETEGQKDKSDNESTLNTVKEGDKISEYDAIAALMIPSANNIARLLARWDSGSQEAFVKKMNDTAKQLGMTNTTYTDPSGLDATTVSTAEDQVKLGLKIVELDALVDITRKPSWTDQTGKNWPNWNRLVPYNESLGIKTGTTTKAGGNLLFAAYKKVGDTNQLIVGAVLGQHKPPIIDTVIAASKNLLVATQKSLEGAPVVKKGDVVGYVDDGVGGRTKVVATADVQAVGWSSLTVDIKLGDGGTKIPGTAKAGTAVGVLTVGDGASQVKVPVALQSELVAPGIGSKLTRIG
ncbi:hypothetical protein [Streptomyces sp. NPDC029721]|uniref:D-alanyl-D-alanine carboxypeptidase n=1 Tax=Streptomyces sp. NPDC029721 TaxID=3157090 RepID=UPI0033C7A7C6